MTYQQTIDYLFTRLPMFSRTGSDAFKKDLGNTKALCHSLGDPHTKFRSIHIAGTNGKGSVSHMLSAILQAAGYKTGLYTSPHLYDFRERIRINGEMVTPAFVTEFTENITPLIEEIQPSFFEITVAMAFEYFAVNEVEIAIVEVGLGGRLDSTNIINPELSIITNIGYDHMNMLGNTLAEIAYEKAGIIKPGVPVIVGEIIDETRPVFEKVAEEMGAEITVANQNRQVIEWNMDKHELVVNMASAHKQDHQQYRLGLTGLYQLKNVLTVIEACGQLRQAGWKIEEKDIREGLQDVVRLTGFKGRWQVIGEHPTTVLDVAHNEDGIRQLVEQIEITDHTTLHMIIGLVKDKDIDSILKLLPDRALYYFTHAHIPRALDPYTLQIKAEVYGLKGRVFDDVNAAMHAAQIASSKTDLVVVCGSVFLVGEVIT